MSKRRINDTDSFQGTQYQILLLTAWIVRKYKMYSRKRPEKYGPTWQCYDRWPQSCLFIGKLLKTKDCHNTLCILLRRLEFRGQPKVKLSFLLRERLSATYFLTGVSVAHPFSVNSNVISSQVGTQAFLVSPHSTQMPKVYSFILLTSQIQPLLSFPFIRSFTKLPFQLQKSRKEDVSKFGQFCMIRILRKLSTPELGRQVQAQLTLR